MMREVFSDSLVDLAKHDASIVLLTGDHGYSLFDTFRKTCPNQYINAGVAEQNMVGMAAGLARTGFRPVVYGLSAFIPIRVLEQIKLDVAHDALPVIFIGDGAGFVYSQLGTSHQSTEDIACTRALPNLQIYSPADAHEMRLCMKAAFDAESTVYLRMGKSDRGVIHKGPIADNTGKLILVKEGIPGGPAFIATGSMLRTSIDLAETTYPDAWVWSAPFIKPIDENQIVAICHNSKVILTFEEHSIYGGLGSVISEIATEHYPSRILRIGVRDKFSDLCGSYDYLLKEHSLDIGSIRNQVSSFL